MLVGHWADPVAAIVLVGYVTVLAVIADIDIRTQLIPTRIVRPLTLGAAAVVLIGGLAIGDLGRSGLALAAGAGFGCLFLLFTLTGGMYMGDVRLSIPIGIVAGWFGLSAITITLLVTTASGALTAVVLLVVTKSRSEFSYGPFLALGSIAGIVASGGGL